VSWNSTWPLGTVSVKQNKLTGQNNTTYVETTLNVDHFFNIGSDEDGHHQFIQSPKMESGGSPSNPSLATGMDGVLYFKEKTAAEAVDQQDVQPFYINEVSATTQIMQLLGIRAMGVFDRIQSNGAVTLQYGHNCSVARTDTGDYTITFTNPLPSDNYLVLGGCVRHSSSADDLGFFGCEGNTTLASKSATTCKFQTYTFSGSPDSIDPLQTWFVVFGG